eukprot:Phypoly_transcript_08166.p1 GENE.Phypoly_transcript_08166~~Phypoly_transcript_08166.p1  ORF type:complete len:510 (+),score=84.93 Phypoly_transcript_08166:209-1531(+)
MSAAQPFILENYLHIPQDKQGSATGNLVFFSELVIIVTSHGWGVLSDQYGRRIVYVIGFVILSIGLGIYPFASSLKVLLGFRLIFAIGAAACATMLSAVLGDYVYIEDRGKASGLLGLAAGGGAVVGALVITQIPNFLATHGSTAFAAGRITYAGVGAIGVLTAIGLLFTLKRHTKDGNMLKRGCFWRIMKEGFFAGKNPKLALAYASGFAARGDSEVVTTFLSLWVYQTAISSGTFTPTDALARAGIVAGVAQTCAVCFAPFAGFLCDKLHRIFALAILAFIAALGYILICFTQDPLGWEMMVGACVVGVGEIGLVVSSTALVAQEAPAPVRGSASGFFAFCGAVGILIATKLGGGLFDRWAAAPLFMFGCFNGVLCLASLIVYLQEKVFTTRSVAGEQSKLVYTNLEITGNTGLTPDDVIDPNMVNTTQEDKQPLVLS